MWRTISFLHEHLLFYLLFTGGINSGSQVFITDPTINPTVIYNNPVRHIAAIAAFPYGPYLLGKLTNHCAAVGVSPQPVGN